MTDHHASVVDFRHTMKTKTLTPPAAKTINSVSDAIDALSDDRVMGDLKPAPSPKRGDQEFGLWFRGHERLSYEMIPSMLRNSVGQGRNYVDEVSLTRHFKAMNPDAARPDASDFEWLVTMQHYLAPTRLLDWTENLLVGLYFAVRDSSLDGKEDAAVWILNARRLNYYSSATIRAANVAFPEDPDVIARSCLCRVRKRDEWHDAFQRELKRVVSDRTDSRQQLIASAIRDVRQIGSSVNDINRSVFDLKRFKQTQGTINKPIDLYERKVGKEPEGLYARLRMPIAVYASRTNRRIRSQSGVFTLHGGKYEPEPTEFEPNTFYEKPIGMPISLLELDSGLSKEKILKWFLIPKTKRFVIRKTLAQIGVTDASLFPELDYQSKYLVSRWTYKQPVE
jgi:FRG domain